MEEEAVAKVVKGRSIPEIIPEIGPDGPSPGLSAIATAAPAPVETTDEKMTRLLITTHSRETALAYLQAILDQHSVNRVATADIPVIEILNEETLSADLRQTLTAEEQANGWIWLVYRVEGRLVFMKAQTLPLDFVPEKVRAHLTDDDLRRFQAAQIASDVERGAARLAKRQRTRPAP